MITDNDRRLFGEAFMDELVEWIGFKLEPGDVFSDADLTGWATDHGYIHADDAKPEHCDESDLERWAEGNGYTRD